MLTNPNPWILIFQHMNSPKHHVKAAEAGQQQKSKDSTSKKLKDIPMLNMFLKTLQPPPQFFKSASNSEKETEECSSSNTEVERWYEENNENDQQLALKFIPFPMKFCMWKEQCSGENRYIYSSWQVWFLDQNGKSFWHDLDKSDDKISRLIWQTFWKTEDWARIDFFIKLSL